MPSLIGCRLIIPFAACAVLVAGPPAAAASWVTIKNDTRRTILLQETVIVNGQEKRCKPRSLLPGESLREFIPGPSVKSVDVFDSQNPRQSLWSGKLDCKDDVQTFSVCGAGGGVTVRTVAQSPHAPRK